MVTVRQVRQALWDFHYLHEYLAHGPGGRRDSIIYSGTRAIAKPVEWAVLGREEVRLVLEALVWALEGLAPLEQALVRRYYVERGGSGVARKFGWSRRTLYRRLGVAVGEMARSLNSLEGRAGETFRVFAKVLLRA